MVDNLMQQNEEFRNHSCDLEATTRYVLKKNFFILLQTNSKSLKILELPKVSRIFSGRPLLRPRGNNTVRIEQNIQHPIHIAQQ